MQESYQVCQLATTLHPLLHQHRVNAEEKKTGYCFFPCLLAIEYTPLIRGHRTNTSGTKEQVLHELLNQSL
jgi:hypothetical protein